MRHSDVEQPAIGKCPLGGSVEMRAFRLAAKAMSVSIK